MAYYGLINPHFGYGIRLYGSYAQHKLERVFRLQRKAVKVILNLNTRESCRNVFRELGFLTLPCLYILEVILYSVSRCVLGRGGDVHQHGTRGRDNFRVQQHRTNAFRNLPSQHVTVDLHVTLNIMRYPVKFTTAEYKRTLSRGTLLCAGSPGKD
ncbi:hypothetical protein J6590_086413 [Homalodisca vitripennis]|nr:hypothetical protein J6590_086413 [Homalodisca vitripennis]